MSAPASRDNPSTGQLPHARLMAFVALMLMVALQRAEAVPLQARVRAFVFDVYQKIAPRPRTSAPVLIVDIDEESLDRYGQWPWPRSLVARLIARIQDMQPAAIGIDVLMPEPDRSTPCDSARHVPDISAALVAQVCAMPSNDTLLARELARGRIALATAGVNEAGETAPLASPVLAMGGDPTALIRHFEAALTSLEELQRAAPGHAMINGEAEYGVVRRIPLVATMGDTLLPSMSIELLRLASGSPVFTVQRSGGTIDGVGVGDLFVPTQEDGSLWIHYGRFDPGRYVSAARVLDGEVDRDRFERRLVLLGVSGLGLVDFAVNALGERVPGVDMHAQIVESIFDGTTIRRPPWALLAEAGATVAIGLVLIFGFASVHSLLAVGATLGSAAVLFLIGIALYVQSRLLVDPATPAILVVGLLGGLTIQELLREQARRRALEESLQRQREVAALVAGEMAAARRIQQGMLPDVRTVFAREPRIDIAARMESAKQVGGDLYDCFMLDADRAFILLGDVCGKGVPASLFMATSKTLCKSVALGDSPGLDEMMRRANREIARDNPEMLFVTTFAGILDLRDGELWYANAGHERPFVAAPGRAPVRLDGAVGVPLGLFEEAEFQTARYRLGGDEFLCVVTDGVTEATDPDRLPFGIARLEKTFAGIAPEDSAEEVLEAVVQSVAEFAAGSEPADDLTVLVVRRRPS